MREDGRGKGAGVGADDCDRDDMGDVDVYSGKEYRGRRRVIPVHGISAYDSSIALPVLIKQIT